MGQKFEKDIAFPREIIFKSIFRQESYTREGIINILHEYNLKGEVNNRASRNGKFISYTITAEFPSDELLVNVCNKISTLKGFMTMF